MSNTGDRKLKTPQLSYRIWLFLISINVILLYLIVDIPTLKSPAVASMAIILFIVLTEVTKFLLNGTKDRMDLVDIIAMSKKFIRMNRIYSIASIIGLVIAILVLSQSIIFSTYYEQQAIIDHIGGNVGIGSNIYLEGVPTKQDVLNWQNEIHGKILEINHEFHFNITNIELDTGFLLSLIVSQERLITDGPNAGNYFVNYVDVQPKKWDLDLYQYLNNFPSFKLTETFDSNSNIMILPYYSTYNISQFISNNTARILVGEAQRKGFQQFSYYEYKFDYIWKPDQKDFEYLDENGLDKKYEIFQHTNQIPLIYINTEKNWDLYDHILTSNLSVNDTRREPSIIARSKVFMEVPIISHLPIGTYIAKLEQFNVDVKNWVGQVIKGAISVTSPLNDALKDYQGLTSLSVSIISFLGIGPILGLSLFLIYFSFTFVEARKKYLIEVMSIRGINKSQLQQMMIIELIFLAIMTSISGMLLSIPFLISIASNFMDNINLNFTNIGIYIPTFWVWRLPLIGIIISIDLNISSIMKLVNIEIKDTKQVITEEKKSFFDKIPIDFVLLTGVISYWFLIYFIPFKNLSDYKFALVYFGPFIIIIFILSYPSALTRIFITNILSLSTNFLRKISDYLFLLSKNINHYKTSTSRLLTFFILVMIFSSMAIILPPTYSGWEETQIKYEIGSQVYIDGIDVNNATNLKTLRNISGVVEVSEIKTMELLYTNYKIIMLGINTTTFSKVAYWKDTFSQYPIQDLLSRIRENSSIAMQKTTMKALGVNIGENYTIFRGIPFSLSVNASFEYFPNLIDNLPRKDASGNIVVSEIPIVANLNTLAMIDPKETFTESAIYLTYSSSYDLETIERRITHLFQDSRDLKIQSLEQKFEEQNNSNESRLINSIFVMMLTMTLIMGILAQLYFALILIQQRLQDIAIFKTHGMKNRQIITLFILEFLVLYLFAIVAGISGGILLSNNFVKILTITNQADIADLQINTIIPIIEMLYLSLVLLTTGIINLLIPLKILGRKTINAIYRYP